MSIAPCKILTVAKNSNLDAGCEATIRTAVSRAYYAALHQACNQFTPQGWLPPKGASSHVSIIDEVLSYSRGLNPGCVEAAQIAKLLFTLKNARKKSDYHLASNVSKTDALDSIKRSERVFELCAYVEKRITAQKTTT